MKKLKVKDWILICVTVIVVGLFLWNFITYTAAFTESEHNVSEIYSSYTEQINNTTDENLIYQYQDAINTVKNTEHKQILLYVRFAISNLALFAAYLWLAIPQLIKTFHRARPVQAE